MEGEVTNNQDVCPIAEASVQPNEPVAGNEKTRGLVDVGGGRCRHLAKIRCIHNLGVVVKVEEERGHRHCPVSGVWVLRGVREEQSE